MQLLSEIIRRNHFIIEKGFHTRDAIIMVLEGRFTCSDGSGSYTAQPGDICVFHAGAPFQRQVLKPLRCIYLQFEPFPLPLKDGLLQSRDAVRTENTLQHLEQAILSDDRELTEHFVWDILLLRSPSAAVSDTTVDSCVRLFEKRFAEHFSLDELAERFSISKQGLIQKFRRSTGKTPMEYLSAVRISRSKQLLRDTTLPISEVAQRCGFENVYYFSNFFKHVTGVRPSDYRKLNDL